MEQIYRLSEIQNLDIPLKKGSIIFLKGDLGAGKTTLTKSILHNSLGIQEEITSPTYTYYNKYLTSDLSSQKLEFTDGQKLPIYHFDLYRLEDYDEFFAIGGEDILDNNTGVILIEWPEIIEKYYKPDLEIRIEKTSAENERKINIIKKQ